LPQSRHAFGRAHQGLAQALAAAAAVHQHLGQVGAVRLVFGLGQHQLHRAANALPVFGHQQRALARRHALRYVTPERLGALTRERVHKTHRGIAFHTVDQNIGKRADLRVSHGWQAPQRPGCCVRHHRPQAASVAITTA
jgi:hypothetical protein